MSKQPRCTIAECVPDERECFLNLFILIFLVGSLCLFFGFSIYDNVNPTPGRLVWEASASGDHSHEFFVFRLNYHLPFYLSSSAWSVLLCSISAALVLALSLHLRNYTAPLVLFCVILDGLLSVVVFTDCNPREIYLWYVCIPLLLLYVRGARSCMTAALMVSVQTTVFRYMRERMMENGSIDCNVAASPFRQTLLGASMSDCWLFALLTMFSALNHLSRTHMLHRLQKALSDRERANRKLRLATEAKSDFLANMSHELRTPMHGIIAMSRELQDMLPPKTKANNAVRIISDCADHLLSLVNDILDFERIESHQLELERIPFSIVSETRKVTEMLRFSAIKKKLNLFTDVRVDHAVRIGDPVRYRQILFNLVSNAIKFTPEEGFVHVTLEAREDRAKQNKDEIVISVEDSGIGISQDDMSRLFTSFSQVDTSVSRRYGGSGLGLAICKRLCDVMGGFIRCESELGKGSTFTVQISLPVVQDNQGVAVDSDVKSEEGQITSDEEEDLAKLKFDGLKVLLVEDNLVNQKVGKRMLHTLGCDVTVANNGVECMKEVGKKRMDVILMDCQMPIMDGFQATQRIRELEKMEEPSDVVRPIPIIALTASATTDYRHKCLDAGMSDVLFKPLKREALADALRRWTSGDRDSNQSRNQKGRDELKIPSDPKSPSVRRKCIGLRSHSAPCASAAPALSPSPPTPGEVVRRKSIPCPPSASKIASGPSSPGPGMISHLKELIGMELKPAARRRKEST